MDRNTNQDHSTTTLPKLITAKQVQQEYLNLSLHYVRHFLNTYCSYRKIGRQYFYSREEVEQKLLATDKNIEYSLAQEIPLKIYNTGRSKK